MKENKKFNIAYNVLIALLPKEFSWEIKYSASKQEYNCHTRVYSGVRRLPYELGINVRFKVDSKCYLYASELLPSIKNSRGFEGKNVGINNNTYKSLKTTLLPKLKLQWKSHFIKNNVIVKF